MKPNFRARYITLDWDNITNAEYRRRLNHIKGITNVRRFTSSLSATKGFHIRIWFYGFVHVALTRRALKDDGRRLVNDILNRDGCIHDILWTRKTIDGITWEEKLIYTFER